MSRLHPTDNPQPGCHIDCCPRVYALVCVWYGVGVSHVYTPRICNTQDTDKLAVRTKDSASCRNLILGCPFQTAPPRVVVLKVAALQQPSSFLVNTPRLCS
ncbi:hypothetical protein I7I48_01883 [Histoplasma ohiense]|nr:hypothetical protein I7I48_01883 [Histoplasma ohiense (nom. inval.)]